MFWDTLPLKKMLDTSSALARNPWLCPHPPKNDPRTQVFPGKIGCIATRRDLLAEVPAAPAAGWRVPWYFDCRHNSEWQRGSDERTFRGTTRVPSQWRQWTLRTHFKTALEVLGDVYQATDL